MTNYVNRYARYRRALTASFFGLSVLGTRLQLFGEDGLKQPAQVTSTERVNFRPGGVIRLNTSSGNLLVEAWDQPEVEIVTIKLTRHSYEPTRQEQAPRAWNASVSSQNAVPTLNWRFRPSLRPAAFSHIPWASGAV